MFTKYTNVLLWRKIVGLQRALEILQHISQEASLFSLLSGFSQARKRSTKPKLLGPDIFWWGGGLQREGAGAKKFDMSLETHGNQTLGRDIPGLPGFPGGARKV